MNSYRVNNKVGLLLATYENGYLTTAGFVKQLEPCEGDITYAGHAGTELPVNWHDLMWIDDRGIKQALTNIDFEECNSAIDEHRAVSKPVFTMADGYKSWTVTEVNDD